MYIKSNIMNSNVIVLHIITGLKTGGAENMLAKLISHTPYGQIKHIVISLTGRGVYSNVIERSNVSIFHINLKRIL